MVNHHDLETFPRRSMCPPCDRKANVYKEKPGYCSGKLNSFCLYWLLSFRCFPSATFRLIPFAKLSWQSWWRRLGGNISGIFSACPGLALLVSFLGTGAPKQKLAKQTQLPSKSKCKTEHWNTERRDFPQCGGRECSGEQRGIRKGRGFLRTRLNHALVRFVIDHLVSILDNCARSEVTSFLLFNLTKEGNVKYLGPIRDHSLIFWPLQKFVTHDTLIPLIFPPNPST